MTISVALKTTKPVAYGGVVIDADLGVLQAAMGRAPSRALRS